MSQIAKRAAVLARAGNPNISATIMTGGAVRAGTVLTTLDGKFLVVEVDHGAPQPANRHQRRAAEAKRRKRHAQ